MVANCVCGAVIGLNDWEIKEGYYLDDCGHITFADEWEAV